MKGISFLITFLLASCSVNKTNLIEFGYGHTYRLSGDEKPGQIDKQIIGQYEELINYYPELQIPINKLIVARDYQIYIGVCLNEKCPAIRKTFALDTISEIIASTGDRYFSRKKDRYIYRFLKDNNKFPSYCISVVSKDSLFIDSTFQLKNNIMRRFSFNE